jgi:hypothetical protein
MRPFDVSPHLAGLVEAYPSAEKLARASYAGGQQVRFFLARLWLSEGIPFAFRNKPAVYEYMRSFLASRLGVDPKDITLIGSARIGQSLSPSTLGRPFSSESDLDLTVVSPDLFNRLVAEFNAWAYDFDSDAARPANSRERRFWNNNLERGPDIIGRGLLDSKMIPLRQPYVLARQLGQTMYLLREKLAATPDAPVVNHADIRVYRSWDAFTRQVGLSLSSARPSATTGTV